MTHMRMLVLVVLLSGMVSIAGGPPIAAPHELYGFLLEQSQAEFDGGLGEPFNKGETPDGLSYRAYRIPGTKTSYLVAVFEKNRAVKLELTGTDYRGPTGFGELTLGQDASAIKPILGYPTEIQHETDVNVDLWDYKPANYSLEFTQDQKLYSIQVVDPEKGQPSNFAGSREVRKYALAIQASDLETMLQMSSGSLVCSGPSEFSFKRDARSDLADRTGKLMKCLSRAAEAIISLGPDMSGADDQIRMTAGAGPFCVTKFSETSPLKEVVFELEVGVWRVYEITFRQKS